MKHAMMRRASTFRKVIAARKRERGSVLFWIIILILLASAGYPIYLWLTLQRRDTGHPRPMLLKEGMTGEIDDAADSSVAEEAKQESENDASEPSSVQP